MTKNPFKLFSSISFVGFVVFVGFGTFAQAQNEQSQDQIHTESMSKLTGQEYYNMGMRAKKEASSDADIEKAGQLLEKSAKLGSESAILVLEEAYKNCHIQARKASEDRRAGVVVNNNDYATASKDCVLAAASGNEVAQYILGINYQFGVMVDKNEKESARWLNQSASHGHVMAQYKMMSVYRDRGDEKIEDVVVTYGWLCALQKQASTPGSVGLNEWQKSGLEKTVWPLKSRLDKLAEEDSMQGSVMKKICNDYIGNYYKKSSP